MDEAEIAEVIREARPELLGDFVRSWAEWDPGAAESYYRKAVEEQAADRIERDRRARLRAEQELEDAKGLAFDQAMAKSKLTEHGIELVKAIVGLSPGSMVGLETPAQAAERADELVRGAAEIQRASREQGIRQQIADAANRTDMALGWGDAEPMPDIEAKIRESRVFLPPASRKTVGELKREMFDDSRGDELENFQAKHGPIAA